MFVVAPQTLLNPSVLETSGIPRRILGRVMIWPRRGADWRFWARLIFEVQPLRYVVALLPFVVAMLVWPELALPIAHAPVPMMLLIAVIETKMLRYTDAGRAALDKTEAERVADALAFKGRRLLSDIAARRGLTEGDLVLVVEQSEMARIMPLTLVSVQSDAPKPHVLDLSPDERAQLGELFDDELTEGALNRANAVSGSFVRQVRYSAQRVSSHARLRAVLAG